MIAQLLRARRALCAAGILGLSALAIPLTSHPASAGLITCELDPTVYLSNGDILTLAAHVNTDISTVTQVNYTLHVPVGVSVTNITYDGYGSLENLTVIADLHGRGEGDDQSNRGDQSGRRHHRHQQHYTASTTVITTTSSAVPVNVHITAGDGGSSSANGMSGQPISISL